MPADPHRPWSPLDATAPWPVPYNEHVPNDPKLPVQKGSPRQPRTLVDTGSVGWTTGAAADAYGPAAGAQYRAVIQVPLVDTRPWLGTEAATIDPGRAVPVDVGDSAGTFDLTALILLEPSSLDDRLVTLVNGQNFKVYAWEYGHPKEPERARLFAAADDVTAPAFDPQVNDTWAYEWVARGFRFWGTGLTLYSDTPLSLSYVISVN